MALPRPISLPEIPIGWYHACTSRDLKSRPVGVQLGAAKYAVFRDAQGQARTLFARCSHMCADLTCGDVIGGVLRCPLHGWEYAADGRCTRIPASADIPSFARQAAFPTLEIGGQVVFHNAPAARFPMPFHEGVSPEELLSAEPFDLIVNTPWFMIGANAFDQQHFRNAHDRTLIDEPIVDSPSPFARRIVATYEVTGDSWRDRFIRRFSGRQVRMSITVWANGLVLVRASFPRTTSYGMVFPHPHQGNRTKMTTVVSVPRHSNAVARQLIDPLNAFIRRRFIRAFLLDDVMPASGTVYHPDTLIDADRELKRYMDWLMEVN